MAFRFRASDEQKHSAAHVLALAVQRIFPEMKVGIGPVTKEGFYYDVYLEEPLTKKDVEGIEEMANQIIEEDLKFKQMILSRESAHNLLLQTGQIFKAELLNNIPDEQISFFKLGEEFIDLCRGPHVDSTKSLGIVRVANIEQVNWQNDPARPKMFRIHGAVFNNEQELKDFISLKKELAERNFVKRTIELGIAKKIGTDSLVLTNEGRYLKDRLEKYFLSNIATEIKEVDAIHLEGHDHLHNQFVLIQNLYQIKNRSHKSLPLNFLIRRRSVSEINQMNLNFEKIYLSSYTKPYDTITTLVNLLESFTKLIERLSDNLTVKIYTSNLEDSNLNTISNFLQKNVISQEKILSNDLEEKNIRIEIEIKDSLDQNWVVGIVELNYQTKSPFYTKENTTENAVRTDVTFNTLQLLAFTLQEKGLELPLYFHPTPVVCIPIRNSHQDYCLEVKRKAQAAGIKVDVDFRSKSLKKKLKECFIKDIPFVFIVGNKEYSNKAISVRKLGQQIGLISLENAFSQIKESI